MQGDSIPYQKTGEKNILLHLTVGIELTYWQGLGCRVIALIDLVNLVNLVDLVDLVVVIVVIVVIIVVVVVVVVAAIHLDSLYTILLGRVSYIA